MSDPGVEDDVGIQDVNDSRRILNGNGYEILGVLGENSDEFDHYGGEKLCGALDYYGDVGQTLCVVVVWLQSGNDNGGPGDDHVGDKIQRGYCCGNLNGNTDGALQAGLGCEGGDDHQDYSDICFVLDVLDPQNEIAHDGEDEDLNEKIVGDVCLCKDY